LTCRARGQWIAGLFSNVENVVSAGAAYFQTMGLVYGFMAVFVILFSAYQGWGRATAPLLVSLLRLVIVVLGGWTLLRQTDIGLDGLYYLMAISVVFAALTLVVAFLWRPPIPVSKVVSG
jgi:Na+-driven multidrug efflux pump